MAIPLLSYSCFLLTSNIFFQSDFIVTTNQSHARWHRLSPPGAMSRSARSGVRARGIRTPVWIGV
jgi:hypothetical protein